MSGPISAVFVAHQMTVLLAAAAIRAARAIRDGQVRADELAGEHAQARSDAAARQAAARRQGSEALEREAAAAEARIDQLAAAMTKLGATAPLAAARPQRPQAADPAGFAAYVRGLQLYADELQNIMLTEAARLRRDVAAMPAGIDLAAALKQAAPAATAQEAPSARLIARIAHLGTLPGDIAKLAEELDATAPGERRELLATELRGRIQQRVEAEQKRNVEEATSLVVEQSLRDLGYQVEDIGDTLFVEGGVVHFKRSGWGDYMVRMRVDPQTHSANFNVVRAVDKGISGENERSVMDHLAEDRWCAEFPALLKALEIQGVQLNVTRRLAAGELPVQLVERGKLPKFAEEESAGRASKPMARELP
jgi:hypothetical protein